MREETHYRQSRRELVTILVVWLVFCVWVVGYCSAFGYRRGPWQLETVLGMPSWVVWGIAVPWVVATLYTVVFGLRVMKDQPLDGGENGEGEGK